MALLVRHVTPAAVAVGQAVRVLRPVEGETFERTVEQAERSLWTLPAGLGALKAQLSWSPLLAQHAAEWARYPQRPSLW